MSLERVSGANAVLAPDAVSVQLVSRTVAGANLHVAPDDFVSLIGFLRPAVATRTISGAIHNLAPDFGLTPIGGGRIAEAKLSPASGVVRVLMAFGKGTIRNFVAQIVPVNFVAADVSPLHA